MSVHSPVSAQCSSLCYGVVFYKKNSYGYHIFSGKWNLSKCPFSSLFTTVLAVVLSSMLPK